MPRFILISALNHKRTIGKDGGIPWHLPNDFKHFKETTLNKTIVMGRKTFASLPSQKPLPKRNNVILSTTLFETPGFICCKSIDEIIDLTKNDDDVYIIGGQNVYEAFLPIASQMILTYVDNHLIGDVFFPMFEPTQWKRVHSTQYQIDDKHKYAYSIQTFNRI
ncbi:MAG: dihydrofolate reductase [Gammaproteobacteria bacterium]|nr:dihydrofolate reductase [Gammaproteobacteria bacterium]